MSNSEEIFLIDSGSLKPLPSRSMRQGLFGKSLEDALQTLLQNYPKLIPGKQIDPESNDPPHFVLLRREVPISGWSLDHLYVDQNGILTLVETKLIQNPESRREVIGQIIEYAANARELWALSRARHLATEYWSKQSKDIDTQLLDEFGADLDIEAFWETVENNLKQGRIRLIIAGDELRPEVRRMIEYLNNEMQNAEVLGLELRCYGDDNGQLVLVPRLIGLSEASRQQKNSGVTTRTSKEDFMDNFSGDVWTFFDETIKRAEQEKLFVYWGVKGFSLRIPGLDGKLNSIFYGYPPGAHGRKNAFVWGYAHNLGEPTYDEDVRKKFLGIPGVSKYGKYGVELEITDETVNVAKQLLAVVWSISQDLRNKTD